MKKILMGSLAVLLLLGCKPTPTPGGGTGGGSGGSGGTGDGGPCDPKTAIIPCTEEMTKSATTDSVTTITIDTTKSEK